MNWWSESNFDARQERLNRGLAHENYVAEYLREQGLDVIQSEFIQDNKKSGFTFHPEDFDLCVNGQFIEVKSRNFSWNKDPRYFRYETLWIDEPAGWDRKIHKPDAVIIISSVNKTMLAGNPKDFFIEDGCHDTDMDYIHQNYSLKREHLKPIHALVNFLRKKSG